MTSLVSWMLKRWSWKSFALGAGAVLVGGTVGRPALVAAVKTGMDVADVGVGTYQQAKAGAISIRDEAVAQRSLASTGPGPIVDNSGLHDVLANIQAELSSLREEIAASKVVPKKAVVV